MLSKPSRGAALLFPGLLAGAFGYGAVNVLYAFREVPLDVRLTFHTALMRVNGPVMQSLMALAVLSTLLLAVRSAGSRRRITICASTLVFISFLVTRFGNVPINQQIKRWAVSGPPSAYADILRRWELFHFARTGCAVVAFVLVITVVVGFADDRRTGAEPTTDHTAARRLVDLVSTVPFTARTFGTVTDGAFKILLSVVYILGAGTLDHRLDVTPWLMIACGAALFLGGACELGYLRRRTTGMYLRLMIAYDSGGVLATIAALLLARQDIRCAGELWIGYQTIAPLIFAAALAAGSPVSARQ